MGRLPLKLGVRQRSLVLVREVEDIAAEGSRSEIVAALIEDDLR